uniref:Uncharacterized protein n=1 Tax=Romanomermis culicivorax TaxID=13658 RepID=A0A915JTP0_ROMCU
MDVVKNSRACLNFTTGPMQSGVSLGGRSAAAARLLSTITVELQSVYTYVLLAEHARRSRKIFYYREHARRANFLCSWFCSTSKYSRAEHARRTACSTLCSPNISEHSSEHARRATSR